MKRYVFVVILMLSLSNCKKDTGPTVYGISLAQQVCGTDMAWLSDIIKKADEDKANGKYLGNYIGTIYLGSYQNKPTFLIQMGMGSGGILYYAFDCSGQKIYPAIYPADAFYSTTVDSGKLIYTNL
ncbi:MAG: hypothetical protein JWM28_1408 [Chitinophagaceae bacterium]|nr:hypothetical protein [Chitinophagaceae bacterium]